MGPGSFKKIDQALQSPVLRNGTWRVRLAWKIEVRQKILVAPTPRVDFEPDPAVLVEGRHQGDDAIPIAIREALAQAQQRRRRIFVRGTQRGDFLPIDR